MDSSCRYLIRSASRIDPTVDSGSCAIKMTSPIPVGTYLVNFAVIPNSIYNISSTNNKIYYTVGGNYSTSITAGHYTSSTIASGVQTALNTSQAGIGNPTGFTVSYSSSTDKLTFTNASTFNFRFSADTANDGAEKQLGFAYGEDTSEGKSITAPNRVNLVKCAGIVIRFSEASNHVIDAQHNDLGSLYYPFIQDYGSNQIYTPVTSSPQYLSFHQPVSVLNCKFYDSDGDPVTLNGSDWEMVISRVNF